MVNGWNGAKFTVEGSNNTVAGEYIEIQVVSILLWLFYCRSNIVSSEFTFASLWFCHCYFLLVLYDSAVVSVVAVAHGEVDCQSSIPNYCRPWSWSHSQPSIPHRLYPCTIHSSHRHWYSAGGRHLFLAASVARLCVRFSFDSGVKRTIDLGDRVQHTAEEQFFF